MHTVGYKLDLVPVAAIVVLLLRVPCVVVRTKAAERGARQETD